MVGLQEKKEETLPSLITKASILAENTRKLRDNSNIPLKVRLSE